MKKRDELMQKEKMDVAASLHAAQASHHMHAAFQMTPAAAMLHTHPSVMSAAAAASSAAALSHL